MHEISLLDNISYVETLRDEKVCVRMYGYFYSRVTNTWSVKRLSRCAFLIFSRKKCDVILSVIQVRHRLWDPKQVEHD